MGMLASFGVGSTILGAFSDKFGRKTILLLSLAMTIPVLAITVNI